MKARRLSKKKLVCNFPNFEEVKLAGGRFEDMGRWWRRDGTSCVGVNIRDKFESRRWEVREKQKTEKHMIRESHECTSKYMDFGKNFFAKRNKEENDSENALREEKCRL